MFSPTLGRWTQNDPIEFEAGDPNLYRFVGNNPTNMTDPSGLQERPVSKVDPGGTYCNISQSDNLIRLVVGPSDKATCLKGIPFYKKENPTCPLDKSKYAPIIITGDRGWSGIIPKGAYIGPDGCGPCVGIALLPPKPGDKVYIMHFSARADVKKGFEEVGFIQKSEEYELGLGGHRAWKKKTVYTRPKGFEAVICGALMPNQKGNPNFIEDNDQRLHTLEDVTNCCRRNGVTVRNFLPTSGFAVDENGWVWWTSDPAVGDGDRYEK